MDMLNINELKENSFLDSSSLSYSTILKQIKKESNSLRPIFEAFSNAWESFDEQSENDNPTINIIIELNDNELPMDQIQKHYVFNKIIIKDNGCGFTDKNFSRFYKLYEDTKGEANKGIGRVQYLHFFDITEFTSVFFDDGKFYERKFILSKNPIFLSRNAIIKYEYTKEIDNKETGTTLVFNNPLKNNNKEIYESLDALKLKESIIKNFILKFCANVNKLPQIKIQVKINGNEDSKSEISKDDIPTEEKNFKIEVPYKKRSIEGIKISDIKEEIDVRTFKIATNKLDKNRIIITAKNECTNTEVELQCLPENSSFNGKRYMFLLSANYFDEKATSDRGKIELYTQKQYEKESEDEEVILIDDLILEANKRIPEEFSEIKEKQKELDVNIDELKKIFLLNDKAIKAARLKASDSDETILRKIYQYDYELLAKGDAELKKILDKLNKLNPTSSNYEAKLNIEINEIVKNIPIQNRTALTQYVARRKLILDHFSLILKNKLECQNDGSRNNNEQLIHNLIFAQHSTNTSISNLWLLNEDFIYFQGCSESKLSEVELNGKKLFSPELEQEEEKYYEGRKIKRPDVLLFPSEGKCIIIEFKAPDVDVSDYIMQVNKYATWILSYCDVNTPIDTFYGYLIGENIEYRDVVAANSDFKQAYQFDYIFRPANTIVNLVTLKETGSLYMEILKYSTLLKRAEQRNSIFMEKLGIK